MLDFLASFLNIFLPDLFLMLPDAVVEEDDVEVPDTPPLFTVEDVPDVIFLPPGSSRSRKLSPLTGWPRMLPGSTLMSSGCSGVSAVVVDDDGGGNVASTAGFWNGLVAALLPLNGAEHVGGDGDAGDAGDGGGEDGDGADGADGVCVDVQVPRVSEHPEPEPCMVEHGVVVVPLLPVPLLVSLLSVGVFPCNGLPFHVPKHPVAITGDCEVLVVPLLPVPLPTFMFSVLLRLTTPAILSACVLSSAPRHPLSFSSYLPLPLYCTLPAPL